jgi:hypothetical protein
MLTVKKAGISMGLTITLAAGAVADTAPGALASAAATAAVRFVAR